MHEWTQSDQGSQTGNYDRMRELDALIAAGRGDERPIVKPSRRCSAPYCENPQYERGFCTAHYQRMHKHGTLEVRSRRRYCEIPGCGEGRVGNGLCRRHYQQAGVILRRPDAVAHLERQLEDYRAVEKFLTEGSDKGRLSNG